MARLQDIINKNKKLVRSSSGQLTEETDKSLQSLTQKAGLQAPPITPLGASSLGASSDSSKMAGTPQQKQAALSMASTPQGDSLADVQRRAQARTVATQTEQQQMQKAQQLQQLGSVGQRAEQFIEKQREALQQQSQAQQQPQIEVASDNLMLQNVAPEKLEEFKSILSQYQQNPQNMQLLVDAGNLLGGRAISPQEIQSLYVAADQALASSVAGAVADKLTVTDLISQPEFGYTAESLADLLGVSPADLATYSVQDLEARVNQLAQEEYSKAADVGQAAESTQLGAAERQLARQQARDISATGIRSTEADVSQLEEQISQGMQVQFGGKSYRIDELLADDQISQIVSDYLQNPESPESKQLAASEPELMSLINKNRTLLEDAVQQMQVGAQEFEKIQQDNRRLTQYGNVELGPELAKQLLPQATGLQATRASLPETSPLNYLSSLPSRDAELAVSRLNELVTTNPEYAEQLSKFSPEEMKMLGIETNSAKWRNFTNAVKTAEELSRIDPTDIESILDQYLGFTGGQEAVSAMFTENQARKALGLPTADPKYLDSDGDGKLDPPEVILANLKKHTPVPSLAQAAYGKVREPASVSVTAPGVSGAKAKLLESLGPAASDGKITGPEISKVFKGTSGADLTLLMDLAKKPTPGMDASAKGELTKLIDKGKAANSKEILRDMAETGLGLTDRIKSIESLLKGKDKYGAGTKNSNYLDTSVLEKELAKLRKQANATLPSSTKKAASTVVGKVVDTGKKIQSGISQAKGRWCFPAGQEFVMADGSLRAIELIAVGDELASGGAVLSLVTNTSDDLYVYRGNVVAGTHWVLVDGNWTTVEQAEGSTKIQQSSPIQVYNLVCANHIMVSSHGVVFSDMTVPER